MKTFQATSITWLIAVLLPLAAAHAAVLEVPLTGLDQVGPQLETTIIIDVPGGTQVTSGIFDTGASVSTLSFVDQFLFDLVHELAGGAGPVPIGVPGGAGADGLGGSITGDISAPVTLHVGGLGALQADFTPDPSLLIEVPNQQIFVGTETGSGILPTIIGTPALSPTAANPAGYQFRADMNAFELDFVQLFPSIFTAAQFPNGLVLTLPDTFFEVAGSVSLSAAPDGSTSAPARIPLNTVGVFNNEPGTLTTAPNPVIPGVSLENGLTVVSDQLFLFDTGAQLSVIDTALAAQLGFVEEFSIDVQGAGAVTTLGGGTFDALVLPRDDNSDGVTDGSVRFTQFPAFVADLRGTFGLDGIFGMNALNQADGLIYNPWDPAGPSVTMTFFTGTAGGGTAPTAPSVAQINVAQTLGLSVGGSVLTTNLPSFQLGAALVPEPSGILLMGIGAFALVLYGYRLRRRAH